MVARVKALGELTVTCRMITFSIIILVDFNLPMVARVKALGREWLASCCAGCVEAAHSNKNVRSPCHWSLLHVQMVARVKALGEWKACLQRGVLPDAGAIPWPAEPLSSTLAAVLSDLEMPRFCRRFPGLLNTVLNQMVGLIKVGIPGIALSSSLLPARLALRHALHALHF